MRYFCIFPTTATDFSEESKHNIQQKNSHPLITEMFVCVLKQAVLFTLFTFADAFFSLSLSQHISLWSIEEHFKNSCNNFWIFSALFSVGIPHCYWLNGFLAIQKKKKNWTEHHWLSNLMSESFWAALHFRHFVGMNQQQKKCVKECGWEMCWSIRIVVSLLGFLWFHNIKSSAFVFLQNCALNIKYSNLGLCSISIKLEIRSHRLQNMVIFDCISNVTHTINWFLVSRWAKLRLIRCDRSE